MLNALSPKLSTKNTIVRNQVSKVDHMAASGICCISIQETTKR